VPLGARALVSCCYYPRHRLPRLSHTVTYACTEKKKLKERKPKKIPTEDEQMQSGSIIAPVLAQPLLQHEHSEGMPTVVASPVLAVPNVALPPIAVALAPVEGCF
jgi:hypothetical protein